MKQKPLSPRSKKPLTRDQIRSRLAEIDLAQTSAIRDLEMDIAGLSGCDAAEVVEEARQILSK
jgi:hypothetical protein